MISVLVELEAPKAGKELPMGYASNQIASFDRGFEPIRMRNSNRPSRLAFGTDAPRQDTFVVRTSIDSRADVEKLKKNPGVIEVFADPEIAPLPGVDCDSSTPSATAPQIAAALGADRLWSERNTRGEGIIIGIVDGGVSGSKFPVVGGWSPDPNYPPGHHSVVWGGHGNMCAFDSLIACPAAQIFDYSVGRTAGVSALLNSALQAFESAILSFENGSGPHVLSNSWGLYQQGWDPFPPGHASNYTHNPNHPFNRKVLEAIDAGILVSFAAGNCGQVCPDERCGPDTGPGRSIRGANGMTRVVCVGAVSIHRDWVGYSSQGPSSLDLEKPDLCGYTHFRGETNCDSGTSAACPIVAGVLGLLRAIDPALTQDRARAALRNTAAHPLGQHFDTRYGRGVVDAYSAAHHLS